MKFVVVLAVVVLAAMQIEYGAGEFRCDKGVPYIENECNSCTCGDNGNLECTLKACSGEKHRDLLNCKVGETFEKDCNKCECVKDRGTICTDKKC